MADPNYIRIGDNSLIEYRNEMDAPDPPGGKLSEYIPFYLGPRSPMLFQIAKGGDGVEKHPQENIIYLISQFDLIKANNLEFYFTDGHARSRTSSHFTDEAYFDRLDWEAIYATNWKNDTQDMRRKDKKQSELLVRNHVPLECILYIGVYNLNTQKKVLDLLEEKGLKIEVRISESKLYYDHL